MFRAAGAGMKLLRNLWSDDSGAVVSTELTMVLGIVVGGLSSGLVALRNGVNKGLASAAEIPFAAVPSAVDIQAKVAQPAPFAAKTLSHADSRAASHSISGSNVNVYLNVQYPSRNDIPAP